MHGCAPFEVRLLGEFELRRGGAAVALPASRKTRALLAYLLLGRFVTPKVEEEARLKRELEEAAYTGMEPAE